MPAKKNTHNNASGKKKNFCVCAEIFHFPMPKFEFWCVGYPTFRKRGLQITAMWLATRCWEITGNSVLTEVSESLIVMWRSIGTCTHTCYSFEGYFRARPPFSVWSLALLCLLLASRLWTVWSVWRWFEARAYTRTPHGKRVAAGQIFAMFPAEVCRCAFSWLVSCFSLFRFFVTSLFRSVAFSLFVFVAMPQRKKIFKPSHARKKFCFSAVFSYSFFHSSSEQLHKFHTRKQRDHIKSN